MQPHRNSKRKDNFIDQRPTQQVDAHHIGIKIVPYPTLSISNGSNSLPPTISLKLFTFDTAVKFRINQIIESFQSKKDNIIVFAAKSKVKANIGIGYYYEIDTSGVKDFKKLIDTLLRYDYVYHDIESLKAGILKDQISLEELRGDLQKVGII